MAPPLPAAMTRAAAWRAEEGALSGWYRRMRSQSASSTASESRTSSTPALLNQDVESAERLRRLLHAGSDGAPRRRTSMAMLTDLRPAAEIADSAAAPAMTTAAATATCPAPAFAQGRRRAPRRCQRLAPVTSALRPLSENGGIGHGGSDLPGFGARGHAPV